MTLTPRFAIGLAAMLLSAGAAAAASRDRNPAHEDAAPGVQSLIAGYAHDNGIPPGLARAVVHIESRGNPRAMNHGAMGLMQLKASTARSVGFGGSASGLLTADTNLHFGIKILADAYRASGGDVCRTLALYQSGHAVRRYTRAERSYCAKARAYMAGA